MALDAGVLDASDDGASDASVVEAGPSEAEMTCEKARAEFEVALAPRIDACVESMRSETSPMVAEFQVDDEGRVSPARAAVNVMTTTFGARAALCVVAAIRSGPFHEPSCARKTLEIRRARSRH